MKLRRRKLDLKIVTGSLLLSDLFQRTAIFRFCWLAQPIFSYIFRGQNKRAEWWNIFMNKHWISFHFRTMEFESTRKTFDQLTRPTECETCIDKPANGSSTIRTIFARKLPSWDFLLVFCRLRCDFLTRRKKESECFFRVFLYSVENFRIRSIFQEIIQRNL